MAEQYANFTGRSLKPARDCQEVLKTWQEVSCAKPANVTGASTAILSICTPSGLRLSYLGNHYHFSGPSLYSKLMNSWLMNTWLHGVSFDDTSVPDFRDRERSHFPSLPRLSARKRLFDD